MDLVRENWKLAAGLTAVAATSALAGAAITKRSGTKENQNQVPQKWIRVGEVSELILYPVKSCKPVNVQEATCTKIGLKISKYLRDRIFLVVDDRMVFQTQTTVPRLTLIHVEIRDNRVCLSGPGVEPVTFIPHQDTPDVRRLCTIKEKKAAIALDCGDEVATWLSKFLEKDGLRLLFHSKEATQRTLTSLQRQFPNFMASDLGAFANQTSYMLMAEESLKMLNTKLENPLTHRNFRPNILISGVIDPFSEESWGYLRIGDSGPIFKASKPCLRCPITTNDPDQGTFYKDGEPLKTLTKMARSFGNQKVDELLGNKPVLGLQMGLIDADEKMVKVGDPVYAAVL